VFWGLLLAFPTNKQLVWIVDKALCWRIRDKSVLGDKKLVIVFA